MKLATFVAFRYLLARRKQVMISVISLIAVVGIAVGVMALIIALAMMTGFQEDIQGKILGFEAHVFVSPVLGGSIDDPVQLMDAVDEIPGVVASAPSIEGKGMFTTSFGSTFAEVLGIDLTRERNLTNLDESIIAGSLEEILSLGDRGHAGVVLGKGLASSLGAQVGDTVRLVLPRKGGFTPFGYQPRICVLDVVGIFEVGFNLFDDARAYLSLDTARKFLIQKDEGVSRIKIRVSPVDQMVEIRSEVSERLGPSDYFVTDLLTLNRQLLSALKLEKILMFIAIGLIVMVASLNIVTTLALMVMEKTRDIGILVSMGARRAQIGKVFRIQGLIIGLIGTVAGDIAGLVVCWILDHYQVIRLSPEIYYIPYVPFQVKPIDFLLISLAAMAISYFATIWPSRQASKLQPVEAIRYE